jgi:hypothetical protein
VRVLADVRQLPTYPHVDPLDRHPGAREESIRQLALLARERKHRAVVVGVGVDVQQATPPVRGKRPRDRVDRRLHTTLRDVGDG